jgi:hypothetical protein
MRRIAGMAVLVGVCAGVPADAGKPVAPTPVDTVLTMRVEGQIGVDANGKLIGYTLKTKLEPKLQAIIDKAVPTWVFFPPMVDGKPTAAKSDMRITLLGKEVEGGYHVTIDNVLFSHVDTRDWHAPTRGKADAKKADATSTPKQDANAKSLSLIDMYPLPQYPAYAVNGIVTIDVNIAADGSILDATPTQCSLYFAGGTAKDLARACKAMEDNAAKAIKRWHVAIDNHGKPIDDAPITATIPVQYMLESRGSDTVTKASEPGHWRLESRTPYRKPKWATDQRFAQRMGTSDSFGGELMPSDSALQLRDGQLGKAL